MTGSLGLRWYRPLWVPHPHAILLSPQQDCAEKAAPPPVSPLVRLPWELRCDPKHRGGVWCRSLTHHQHVLEKATAFPLGDHVQEQRPSCPSSNSPWAPSFSTAPLHRAPGMPGRSHFQGHCCPALLTSHLRVCRGPEGTCKDLAPPSHQPSHAAQTNTRSKVICSRQPVSLMETPKCLEVGSLGCVPVRKSHQNCFKISSVFAPKYQLHRSHMKIESTK